jgi:hypothetical protein
MNTPSNHSINEDFYKKTNADSLGIDVGKDARYIRNIINSNFGEWIYRKGYDLDDITQDVCRGILVRNKGRGSWDKEKSSKGHYIYMVARGILANLDRKYATQHEVLGVNGSLSIPLDAELSSSEGRAFAHIRTNNQEIDINIVNEFSKLLSNDPLDLLCKKCLPYIYAGMMKKDIMTILNIQKKKLDDVYDRLREVGANW